MAKAASVGGSQAVVNLQPEIKDKTTTMIEAQATKAGNQAAAKALIETASAYKQLDTALSQIADPSSVTSLYALPPLMRNLLKEHPNYLHPIHRLILAYLNTHPV